VTWAGAARWKIVTYPGKRLFDVVCSGILLVLSSPVLAAAVAAIRLAMGSPMFFSQRRPGALGGPFLICKLRTMNNAWDADGHLAHLGIEAKLHVMLHVPHRQVPLWLNAADAVLMTSHHEGSPNIVKEALACNRPVVSVDVGDVRERIEGIEGCHIAASDPSDLAAKLTEVAAGPRVVEARSRMEELSIEVVADRLIRVYRAAVSEKVAG